MLRHDPRRDIIEHIRFDNDWLVSVEVHEDGMVVNTTLGVTKARCASKDQANVNSLHVRWVSGLATSENPNLTCW